MTNRTKAAESRGTRFIPKQFGIGALLLWITFVACFLRWYVQPPQGTITERELEGLKVGQPMNDVRQLLGRPARRYTVGLITPVDAYLFRIRSGMRETGTALIEFKRYEDTVAKIKVIPVALEVLLREIE